MHRGIVDKRAPEREREKEREREEIIRKQQGVAFWNYFICSIKDARHDSRHRSCIVVQSLGSIYHILHTVFIYVC